jgi:hypothetical protein
MAGFSAMPDERHSIKMNSDRRHSIKMNSNRGVGERGSPAQHGEAVPRDCPMSGTGVLEVAMKCRLATAPPEEI